MILRLVLIALLLNFLFFNISYAYIDPNTGGFFSRNNDSENSAKDQ